MKKVSWPENVVENKSTVSYQPKIIVLSKSQILIGSNDENCTMFTILSSTNHMQWLFYWFKQSNKINKNIKWTK